ncbi:hypothetical protein Q3G72_007462 [Acer saccharum]|nr:hypothetical protein Q3G72_007462 [Acer saccharum]
MSVGENPAEATKEETPISERTRRRRRRPIPQTQSSCRFLRNKGLQCLIGQINDLTSCLKSAGDFQLFKIEILKDSFPMNARKEKDAMESYETHDVEV